MSVCSWLCRRIFEAAVVFLVITFAPGLPPQMSFTAFSITEPVELEGVFALNNKLNGAERLFEGDIKGPEGFAVFDNTLYTGLKGGAIVKVVGDKLVPVADLSRPCEGFWDEVNCGRLLGMTFDKFGMLYVADAQYGVYKVNVKTGAKSLIFSSADPIEGKVARLVNSVAVTDDAKTIYWTTSSTEADLEDGLLSLLGDPSGRLYKYDVEKKTHTLLMDKVHFANGVALSVKEEFLVIAETVRGRVFRYWLKGPKAGQHEIFVDGLPGMPDNLRRSGKGGFYVPLITPRFKTMPVLSDVIAPYPVIRRFLARLICILQAPAKLVNKYYPNPYTGGFTYMLGNFEMLTPFAPKALIVVEIDESGQVIQALQSSDNLVTGISDVELLDQTYYFGSPFNNYLGRLKTRIPIRVKMSDITAPPPVEQPKPTAAPTTKPPATKPSTTKAPATKPPTTVPPTTRLPQTTQAPTTKPPTTKAPTTQPPTTKPPTTKPPTTKPPTTKPPATKPPTTKPPTTKAPTTQKPATTQKPVTQKPVTQKPVQKQHNEL